MNQRICSVEGCGKNVIARKFCPKHYYRYMKYGTALPTGITTPEDHKANREKQAAFIKKVISESSKSCVIWPFSTCRLGYGRTSFRGKDERAHRAVLEIVKPLDSAQGLHAAHEPIICHDKLCINPNHLRWATPKQNSDDRKLDKTVPIGENHWKSKLKVSDVQEITGLLPYFSDQKIAERFPVKYTTITAIRSGKTWSHITGIVKKNDSMLRTKLLPDRCL